MSHKPCSGEPHGPTYDRCRAAWMPPVGPRRSFELTHKAGDEFQDILRLRPTQRSDLLRKMDEAAKSPPAGGNKPLRANERFDYRIAELPLMIQHPGGSVGRFVVSSRNLSAGGISLLHGGYLHKGTVCRVMLTTAAGESKVVVGQVVACRHVSKQIHEVGIAFSEKLDIDEYCSPEQRTQGGKRGGPSASREISKLDGLVLVIVSNPAERRVVASRLSAGGLMVSAVESVGPARDLVKRLPFDVAVLEAPKDNAPANDPVPQLRAEEFTGEFVTLAPKTPQVDAWCTLHAITGRISRPYEIEALVQEIKKAVDRAGARSDHAHIFSTLKAEAGGEKMALYFVNQATTAAAQLEEAIAANELDRVKQLANGLAATAGGYGFAAVYEVAKSALTVIEQSKSLADAAPNVRILASICRRLKAGPAPGAGNKPATAAAKPAPPAPAAAPAPNASPPAKS